MKLTKHEFVALEIFKYKNLSVDDAWEAASKLLAKSSETQTKVLASVSSPLDVNLDDLYVDCIPQGSRKPEVGQMWCNWYKQYVITITQEDLLVNKADKLNSNIQSIFPSDSKANNKHFLESGWQWELMREGEDFANCKARVLKERERILKLDFWQSTPLETVGRLADIDITVRTSNILKAIKTCSYADILKSTPFELLKHPHFGRKTLKELTEELSKHNLYLGMLKLPN